MKKLYLISFLLVILASSLDAAIERRAAFDFGSGAMKLQVAEVDVETGQITKSLYKEDIPVRLSEDLAHQADGRFSETAQKTAMAAARTLKQKALAHQAESFRGIATEAYRKAGNGQELLERYHEELGIPVTIIAQKEEGGLGFWSLIEEAHLDPAHTVSWDIGGGSTQITYLDAKGELQVYMAPLGRSSTKNALIAHVKQQDPKEVFALNPVTEEEYAVFVAYLKNILPDVPAGLSKKLKQPETQFVNITSHPDKANKNNTLFYKDLKTLLDKRLNQTDEQLAGNYSSPAIAVSDIALIDAVLQKLGAHEVHYHTMSEGSTSGLLVTEDFWK